MMCAPVDSFILLQRVRKIITELIRPSWVIKPPPDVGSSRAGTLKAGLWRTLFEIYVPLGAISLWNPESPLAAADAEEMTPVLDTTMHLTCAALAMVKRNLTVEQRERFRHHLIEHIEGVKKNFPGFIYPSSHLAFHLYDIMDDFSGVRHWWCFPFENLIGKLQRIPHNHKPGECISCW